MATSETSQEAHTVAVDPSSPPKVSIVVPAFNEAVRIGESLWLNGTTWGENTKMDRKGAVAMFLGSTRTTK
jgi:hypothetical protein